METFASRFATFCDWRCGEEMETMREFARAGFYKRDVFLSCPFCRVNTLLPPSTVTAKALHELLSPDCAFVTFHNDKHVDLLLHIGYDIDVVFEVYKQFSTRRGTFKDFVVAVDNYKKKNVTLECDMNATCKICMVNAIENVWLPCRHAISCIGCSEKLHKCALCKTPIYCKLQIYL